MVKTHWFIYCGGSECHITKMKHLWEIADWIYEEAKMNHGEKGYFGSWKAFKESGADGCNCVYGNSIVHWGWRPCGVDEDVVYKDDEDEVRAYLKKNSSYFKWSDL